MELPPLIDTHCHLESFVRRGELEPVLACARGAGLAGVITVGTSPKDWELYAGLAAAAPGWVHHTEGLHPCDVEAGWEEVLRLLERRLERPAAGPRPVALGECGLDRFHLPKDPEAAEVVFSRQREAFRVQLALAARTGLPVVVHSRGAFAECVAEVDASGVPWARVVFHCFTEGKAELAALRARGGRASYTGILTYRTAGALREALAEAGVDGAMVETDAPYLAPVPHRGAVNEPAYVVHTAREAAGVLGIPVEAFAEASTRAARAFYGI